MGGLGGQAAPGVGLVFRKGSLGAVAQRSTDDKQPHCLASTVPRETFLRAAMSSSKSSSSRSASSESSEDSSSPSVMSSEGLRANENKKKLPMAAMHSNNGQIQCCRGVLRINGCQPWSFAQLL